MKRPGLTRLSDTEPWVCIRDKVVGQKLWLAGRSSDDNSPRRDSTWRLLIDAGSVIVNMYMHIGIYADCTFLAMHDLL